MMKEIKPSKDAFKRFLKLQEESDLTMMEIAIPEMLNISLEEHMYILRHYDKLKTEDSA